MSGIAERTLDELTPLRHEGIPFSGRDAFLAAATGLLRTGAESGQACLLLADARRIGSVRAEFADGGGDCWPSYLDMSLQGRNPARVLPALQSFVTGHPDQELCIVAEPMPVVQPEPVRAEVELAEWIFGLPQCREWPASIWCLYDDTALDPTVIASLKHAHRRDLPVAEAQGQLAARFREPLPPAPRDARIYAADLTTLGEMRRTVGRFAGAAGLDDERIADLVYAVNEVVTNSICHGEGRARVLLWAEAHAVYCQVDDRGRIDDLLVGRIAPRPGQANGRGLWLVNQLCDLVQVRSSASGTTVRLSVDF